MVEYDDDWRDETMVQWSKHKLMIRITTTRNVILKLTTNIKTCTNVKCSS